MGLFGKESDAVKNAEDRELIEANSKAIDTLLVLAEGNADITNELSQLQETLKYLIPSVESKVMDADKKIRNLIGDLRIALTKSDGEESKKVGRYLSEIKLAVADRNTRL